MVRPTLEVCAYSVQSCINAQKGGAARVELCARPNDDGTTPPNNIIEEVRKAINIKLHVMIRPRGGHFVYSAQEITAMEADIDAARHCGADGVVFGCLTAKAAVDMEACKRLMTASKGLATTFHRAFDVVANPFVALENIIEVGFDRILTSGLASTAVQGSDMIARLIMAADGRIIIMPGCGVNSLNVGALAAATHAVEFHSSARLLSSKSGSDTTSIDMVKDMVKILGDV